MLSRNEEYFKKPTKSYENLISTEGTGVLGENKILFETQKSHQYMVKYFYIKIYH